MGVKASCLVMEPTDRIDALIFAASSARGPHPDDCQKLTPRRGARIDRSNLRKPRRPHALTRSAWSRRPLTFDRLIDSCGGGLGMHLWARLDDARLQLMRRPTQPHTRPIRKSRAALDSLDWQPTYTHTATTQGRSLRGFCVPGSRATP